MLTATDSARAPTGKIWRWFGGLVLLLVLIGLLMPARVHIERTLDIDARAATIFALLNDFHQMEKWSSKAGEDPNARVEISGPPRGVGASISWSGQIVGQGQQTITASDPFGRILTLVDLGAGKEATVSFDLQESGSTTRVIWSWERDYGWNIAGRYFGIIQDGIIGAQIVKDLTSLGAMATRLPRADFSDLQVEQIIVEAIDIAFLRTTSIPQAMAISTAMGDSYFEILNFIDRFGLVETGAPLSITRGFSGSELVFDAAIPVRGLSAATPRSGQSVEIGATYAGLVIRVRHIGSYGTLGQTHDKIAAYLAAVGIARNGDAWESYVSDPTRTTVSELLTYVYYPIRLQE
jgi:effector-binding domain-containing protein